MLVDARTSSAGVKQRNQVIDVFRFFAAAGIVFIHSAQSTSLEPVGNFFRFAVPFYLFASLYFQSLSLRRNADRTLSQYVAGRFKRLYFPFLAWSVIYLVVRDVKRVLLESVPAVGISPALLWKGTEYHLWFLPFLLAASLLLVGFVRFSLKQSPWRRWVVIGGLIAVGVVMGIVQMPPQWDQNFDHPMYAYVQFWRSIPAACWALAFAILMTTGPVVYGISMRLGVAGLLLALVCCVKQFFHGVQLIPRGLSGLGSFVAAMAPWHGSWIAPLARLGQYGYGVYLSHVLVIELIQVLMSRAHIEPSPGMDMLTFAFSFVGSLVLVRELAKWPKLAWLNG